MSSYLGLDSLIYLYGYSSFETHHHFLSFQRTSSLPAIEVRNSAFSMPFLHLVFMMCNERVGILELDAAHGCKNSIFNWPKLYHQAISKLVSKKALNKIGGNERCAVDETIGKGGRKARRPCKTLWKQKAERHSRAMWNMWLRLIWGLFHKLYRFINDL